MTVLNKSALTSTTTRLRWSTSASLPLHPYTTGGSTAQGPYTNPHTKWQDFFYACDFFTLVSIIIKLVSIT